MWFLRLAKSQQKLFGTLFLFGTKIKSTYKKVLPNTRILDLSVKQEFQHPIQVLGPTQKWDDFPPTFYEQFNYFLVVCHFFKTYKKLEGILMFRKNMAHFVFKNVKNEEVWLILKHESFGFFFIIDFCFMEILHFWQSPKSTFAIFW